MSIAVALGKDHKQGYFVGNGWEEWIVEAQGSAEWLPNGMPSGGSGKGTTGGQAMVGRCRSKVEVTAEIIVGCGGSKIQGVGCG